MMNTEIKKVILSDHTLKEHFRAYAADREEYVEQLNSVYSNKQLSKNVTNNNKTKALVVLIQSLDKEGFRGLLNHIDLPELTKACEILDSNRLMRQLKKKVSNYRIENRIKMLKETNEGMETLSLSLAKIKLVREWVKNLTPEQLVYRALLFPVKDNWKKLADLTHLNPSKDFTIDWFLPYCYGTPAPSNTIVAKFENMTLDNFIEIDNEYNLSYKLFRAKFADELKRSPGWDGAHNESLEKIKVHFAKKEKLKECLWWWDELHNTAVDKILTDRLRETSYVDLSYGKLVDLLMKVKHKPLFEELVRIAENRLSNFELCLDSPVVVLGDASSSMQVAINTSSIITSLLCSLAKAELRLFKTTDIPVPNPPKTVRQAIEFAQRMQATNSTSPASSLYPYYESKKVIKTFIIVTDEEENTSSSGYTSWYGRTTTGNNGYFFADLYKKYCEEVYPAKLVFISFSRQNEDAFMAKELKRVIGESKFSEFVQVFKFDTRNPDLNRLDFVLEKMSASPELKVVKL